MRLPEHSDEATFYERVTFDQAGKCRGAKFLMRALSHP